MPQQFAAAVQQASAKAIDVDPNMTFARSASSFMINSPWAFLGPRAPGKANSH